MRSRISILLTVMQWAVSTGASAQSERVVNPAHTAIVSGVIRDSGREPNRVVLVCLEVGPGKSALSQAQDIAAHIFLAIGVTIRWHAGLAGCPDGGLQVHISSQTPETFHPGAFGSAVPLEGTHVLIYYDRIAGVAHDRLLLRHLWAHVLVHEITHMIEGVPRHSGSGVMKAHWDQKDCTQMLQGPLAFDKEDLALIEAGLAARAQASGRS